MTFGFQGGFSEPNRLVNLPVSFTKGTIEKGHFLSKSWNGAESMQMGAASSNLARSHTFSTTVVRCRRAHRHQPIGSEHRNAHERIRKAFCEYSGENKGRCGKGGLGGSVPTWV